MIWYKKSWEAFCILLNIFIMQSGGFSLLLISTLLAAVNDTVHIKSGWISSSTLCSQVMASKMSLFHETEGSLKLKPLLHPSSKLSLSSVK